MPPLVPQPFVPPQQGRQFRLSLALAVAAANEVPEGAAVRRHIVAYPGRRLVPPGPAPQGGGQPDAEVGVLGPADLAELAESLPEAANSPEVIPGHRHVL